MPARCRYGSCQSYARRGTTVALSGEGADELFGGYLTYRANRLSRMLRRFPRGMIEFGLGALKHWPVSDEKIGLDYKLKRFAGRFADHGRASARLLERHILGNTRRRLLLKAVLPRVHSMPCCNR